MPEMHIIARVHTPFAEKFGVPRQSGLVDGVKGTIIFEPEFRNADAVRGLDGFSHLWLIWQFDRAVRKTWSPTVRPPRLGGNERMGVFATRSPFRPNAIGLSSVKLEKVEIDPKNGPILHIIGADLVDGTPIFDIKPYLAYCDSHPEAKGGFTDGLESRQLKVNMAQEWLEQFPLSEREGLLGVLESDPRPRYQDDPERVYGMRYGNCNVKFTVNGDVLTVVSVEAE